ncbi:MAG: hypothetical protein ABL892_05425 [Thiobacillaceae bacterium]
MLADQAAGLRRSAVRRDTQVITILSGQAAIAQRLARAIQLRGRRVLLVDTTGRHAMAGQAQSIFGWQQQVARKQVQPVCVNGIDLLRAPGAPAGDAGIVQASNGCDTVLFDSVPIQSDVLALASRPAQTLIVQVDADTDAICNAYALIKSLAENNLDWPVFLVGKATQCERIISAVKTFLSLQPSLPKWAALEEDAHFAALAAKITADETDVSRLYKDMGAIHKQHG